MKNGVPFHIALGMTRAEADALVLSKTERIAMSIMFGEIKGSKFNWRDFDWEKPQ